jgi:hypothetical protein
MVSQFHLGSDYTGCSLLGFAWHAAQRYRSNERTAWMTETAHRTGNRARKNTRFCKKLIEIDKML